jgi:hypothetical protein
MLTVGLILLCGLSSAFLLVHGLTRPWWRSWESRALIASSLGWALLSGGFLWDDYAGDIPHWVWVLIAYLAVVAAALKLGALVASRRRKP